MNQSLSNAQCDVASKNKSPSEILRAFNGGWLHNLSVECKRVKETSESSRNDTFLRVKSVWASIPSLASLAVCSSSVPSGPVGILDPVHPSAAWCSSTVTCLGNLAERRPHSPREPASPGSAPLRRQVVHECFPWPPTLHVLAPYHS